MELDRQDLKPSRSILGLCIQICLCIQNHPRAVHLDPPWGCASRSTPGKCILTHPGPVHLDLSLTSSSRSVLGLCMQAQPGPVHLDPSQACASRSACVSRPISGLCIQIHPGSVHLVSSQYKKCKSPGPCTTLRHIIPVGSSESWLAMHCPKSPHPCNTTPSIPSQMWILTNTAHTHYHFRGASGRIWPTLVPGCHFQPLIWFPSLRETLSCDRCPNLQNSEKHVNVGNFPTPFPRVDRSDILPQL